MEDYIKEEYESKLKKIINIEIEAIILCDNVIKAINTELPLYKIIECEDLKNEADFRMFMNELHGDLYSISKEIEDSNSNIKIHKNSDNYGNIKFWITEINLLKTYQLLNYDDRYNKEDVFKALNYKLGYDSYLAFDISRKLQIQNDYITKQNIEWIDNRFDELGDGIIYLKKIENAVEEINKSMRSAYDSLKKELDIFQNNYDINIKWNIVK